MKLEEQLKIEVKKNATLVTEKNTLAEKLATQDEIIDEKDATIEKLRKENVRLIQELQQHGQSSLKERFVVFGFGENGLQQLGLVEGETYPKVKITLPDYIFEPFKLEHFGDVEFVDANDKVCTIDRDGVLFLNGVKQTGIAKRAIMATSDLEWRRVICGAGGRFLRKNTTVTL